MKVYPQGEKIPSFLLTVEANKSDKNVFYYGHLDKLPEVEEWTDKKEAFNPSKND